MPDLPMSPPSKARLLPSVRMRAEASGASGSGDGVSERVERRAMNVDGIDVVRATMPRVDPQWRTASYAASSVEGLILQVHADGHTGLGAAIARPNGTPADVLERAFIDPVRRLLVGRDVSAHTLILHSLQMAEVHRSVVSAVDMALYDLLGKAVNLPCHALWGGAVSSTLQIVRMVGIKPPAELVTAVGSMMEEGFTHFKVKLGTAELVTAVGSMMEEGFTHF
ncbi:MAG: hypothetical protein GEU73_14800, partial [Chloroflexi bacterium]|nr:hypothetical protein [Chloroflexota bacterium]